MDLPTGGTTDVVYPPGQDPYTLLSNGHCDELLRMVESWPREVNPVPDADFYLYHAAAQACLLHWDEARNDMGKFAVSTADSLPCVRQTVLDWIRGRLAAHDADPAITFTFVTRPGLGACPVSLPTQLNNDQIGPAHYDAYQALSLRDCNNLLNTIEAFPRSGGQPGTGISDVDYFLYRSAAQVCLLAWEGAQADFVALSSITPPPALSCPKKVVFEWLRNILKDHAASPEVGVHFESVQAKPQCPVTGEASAFILPRSDAVLSRPSLASDAARSVR